VMDSWRWSSSVSAGSHSAQTAPEHSEPTSFWMEAGFYYGGGPWWGFYCGVVKNSGECFKTGQPHHTVKWTMLRISMSFFVSMVTAAMWQCSPWNTHQTIHQKDRRKRQITCWARFIKPIIRPAFLSVKVLV
jgi:hypothetical protein